MFLRLGALCLSLFSPAVALLSDKPLDFKSVVRRVDISHTGKSVVATGDLIKDASRQYPTNLNAAQTEGFCTPVTNETRVVLSFNAQHKMGTFLHTRGAYCLQQHFNAVNKPIALAARGGCETYRLLTKATDKALDQALARTQSQGLLKVNVHWTRDPFAWVQSNYLYDKRGDEHTHFIDMLRQPDVLAKLSSTWKQLPVPLPEERYDTYLGRISEDDGLFLALYKGSGGWPDDGSLNDLLAASADSAVDHSVCLDDFMKSHASFMASWRRIMSLVGEDYDNDKDSELVTCLSNIDPSINEIKHATSLAKEDASRIQSKIRRIDARYYDGLFDSAARKIGCPRY
jgi:hypothetical protein